MPAEHVVEGAFVRGQEVAGGTAISYAYFFWRAVDVFEHADAGHVIRRRQNRAQRQPALRSNPLRIGKIAVCHVQLGQENPCVVVRQIDRTSPWSVVREDEERVVKEREGQCCGEKLCPSCPRSLFQRDEQEQNRDRKSVV